MTGLLASGALRARPAPGPAVTEELVARVWDRQQLLGHGRLQTETGPEVQVVYPGWRGREAGPDFREALIALDGQLQRGDVEVHLHARDWDSHGHGDDPRYRRVILHVCLWADGAPASRRQDGELVPVLALYPHLRGSLEQALSWAAGRLGPREPCGQLSAALGRQALQDRLAALGERRLRAKALRLQAEAAVVGWEQGAYQSLLEGCGYSQNRASFLEIAGRLPVATLAGLIAGKAGARRRELLAGLLFGAAGLLEAGLPLLSAAGISRDEVARVAAAPRLLALAAPGPALAWNTFRLRPANHPARRLLGALLLLERHLEEGLVGWLVPAVRAAAAGPRPLLLQREFSVAAPPGGGCKGCLIGPERARELAINLALPLALAWGEETSDSRLSGAARRLFGAFPAASGSRALQETLGHLLGDGHGLRLSTAPLQQGVLQLRRDHCLRGRCAACPLRPLAS